MDASEARELANQLDWTFKSMQRRAIERALVVGSVAPESVAAALSNVVTLRLAHKEQAGPGKTRFLYNGFRAGVVDLVLAADRTVVSVALLENEAAMRRVAEARGIRPPTG